MDPQQILKFCLERGLLVDKDVLSLFSESQDFESVKMVIEKIKSHTQQKIITKELFSKNREQVTQVFSSLPEEKQKNIDIQSLKLKLGLSIEISKEIISKTVTPAKENILEEPKIKIVSNSSVQTPKINVENFVNHSLHLTY